MEICNFLNLRIYELFRNFFLENNVKISIFQIYELLKNFFLRIMWKLAFFRIYGFTN